MTPVWDRARNWTGDLWISRRVLYHWANSPPVDFRSQHPQHDKVIFEFSLSHSPRYPGTPHPPPSRTRKTNHKDIHSNNRASVISRAAFLLLTATLTFGKNVTSKRRSRRDGGRRHGRQFILDFYAHIPLKTALALATQRKWNWHKQHKM